jgi:hypothetical protein
MYKGIRKRKREKLKDIKLVQNRCQNLSISKIDACSRLAVFLHVKNQPLAIGRPWRWEVCLEGAEVGK